MGATMILVNVASFPIIFLPYVHAEESPKL